MPIIIDFQQLDTKPSCPLTGDEITSIFERCLLHLRVVDTHEITLRLVSLEESRQLNSDYRGKDAPTNVLSFTSDIPNFIDSNFLGDLVVCNEILERESAAQHKSLRAHWTHILVHGLLHLMGYDHIVDADAAEMEQLEVSILAQFGIADPYSLGAE